MEGKQFEFEVTAHIAVLSTNKRGGSLELNKTKVTGYPEKWDLRRWYKDENGERKPGKGITLSDLEFEEMKAVLMDY